MGRSPRRSRDGVDRRHREERREGEVRARDAVGELFGRPDHFLRVAVSGHAAYEAFLTGRLSGLPGVLRAESHLTMKSIKADF